MVVLLALGIRMKMVVLATSSIVNLVYAGEKNQDVYCAERGKALQTSQHQTSAWYAGFVQSIDRCAAWMGM